MVEHEDRARRDERALRQPAVEFGAVGRQPLEVAHDIVARGADQPAVKRNFRDGGLEFRAQRQRLAHEREPVGRAAGLRSRRAVEEHLVPVRAKFERQTFAEAEEGVARQPFAALHALQQKARLERRELEIRRDGRIEIGRDVER